MRRDEWRRLRMAATPENGQTRRTETMRSARPAEIRRPFESHRRSREEKRHYGSPQNSAPRTGVLILRRCRDEAESLLPAGTLRAYPATIAPAGGPQPPEAPGGPGGSDGLPGPHPIRARVLSTVLS